MFLNWDALVRIHPQPLTMLDSNTAYSATKQKVIQPLKQAGLFLQPEAILLLSIFSGHGSVNVKQPICS